MSKRGEMSEEDKARVLEATRALGEALGADFDREPTPKERLAHNRRRVKSAVDNAYAAGMEQAARIVESFEGRGAGLAQVAAEIRAKARGG